MHIPHTTFVGGSKRKLAPGSLRPQAALDSLVSRMRSGAHVVLYGRDVARSGPRQLLAYQRLCQTAVEAGKTITVAGRLSDSAVLLDAAEKLSGDARMSLVSLLWTYRSAQELNTYASIITQQAEKLRVVIPPVNTSYPLPIELIAGMGGAGKTEAQAIVAPIIHRLSGIQQVVRVKTGNKQPRKSEPDADNHYAAIWSMEKFHEFAAQGAFDPQLTYPHPNGSEYGIRSSFHLVPAAHECYVSRIDGAVRALDVLRFADMQKDPAREYQAAEFTRPVRLILLDAPDDVLTHRIAERRASWPLEQEFATIEKNVQSERQVFEEFKRVSKGLVGSRNVSIIDTTDFLISSVLGESSNQPDELRAYNSMHATARAILRVMASPLHFVKRYVTKDNEVCPVYSAA